MLKNRKRNGANDSVAKASHQLDSAQKRNLLVAMDSGEKVLLRTSRPWRSGTTTICLTLLEFDLRDIWNELGLSYRQVPSKSLVGEEEGTPKGVKLKKERVTVLLTGNALGERFPVWLVGKSEQPRAFTKAGVSSRDTIKHNFCYRHNSTSWMTGKIFSEFLEELNKKMISQERKIALIVDNFSGRKVNETSNIRIFFLPPNYTSKAQPFDAGIIKSFKDHFRRRMCHDVYAKRESFKTAEGYFKTATVWDACLWSVEADEAVCCPN
ncbi:hypothetical protein RvY_14656 [Ramazzottius varieornatus]|uniref:DDE-1 domain-containing protein n=1 Tax=Ramazzottius varieornatus TaxID=947166 RepID=A0A1D1VX50_RAMVA|nr:hypothetical protein RvY_14656 [Ramazzottius varieornatus]